MQIICDFGERSFSIQNHDFKNQLHQSVKKSAAGTNYSRVYNKIHSLLTTKMSKKDLSQNYFFESKLGLGQKLNSLYKQPISTDGKKPFAQILDGTKLKGISRKEGHLLQHSSINPAQQAWKNASRLQGFIKVQTCTAARFQHFINLEKNCKLLAGLDLLHEMIETIFKLGETLPAHMESKYFSECTFRTSRELLEIFMAILK